MEYHAFAFIEVLTYLINEKGKTKLEQNEMHCKNSKSDNFKQVGTV